MFLTSEIDLRSRKYTIIVDKNVKNLYYTNVSKLIQECTNIIQESTNI